MIPRIGAILVAVALVVGALVIRSNRDAEKAKGPYRLTCATELAEACRALPAADVTVTVEPAGVTADRVTALVAGADPGFDGWLAGGRWATAVAEARRAAGLPSVTTNASVVGHTKLAVVVWSDRLAALRQACGAPLTWRCLGDAAARGTWKANKGQEAWGPVKIAMADPVTETAGLIGLAAATVGFDANVSLVPADLAQNDPYQKWLTGFARALQGPPPSLAEVLTSGAALADVYIGLDSEVAPVVATSARRGEVEVVYLSPVFDVEAVLAGGSRSVPKGLAAAVQNAGFTARAAGPTALPAAGNLAGLRTLWKDTIR